MEVITSWGVRVIQSLHVILAVFTKIFRDEFQPCKAYNCNCNLQHLGAPCFQSSGSCHVMQCDWHRKGTFRTGNDVFQSICNCLHRTLCGTINKWAPSKPNQGRRLDAFFHSTGSLRSTPNSVQCRLRPLRSCLQSTESRGDGCRHDIYHVIYYDQLDPKWQWLMKSNDMFAIGDVFVCVSSRRRRLFDFLKLLITRLSPLLIEEIELPGSCLPADLLCSLSMTHCSRNDWLIYLRLTQRHDHEFFFQFESQRMSGYRKQHNSVMPWQALPEAQVLLSKLNSVISPTSHSCFYTGVEPSIVSTLLHPWRCGLDCIMWTYRSLRASRISWKGESYSTKVFSLLGNKQQGASDEI